MIEFASESRVELIKTNATDLDVARAAWVSNFGEDAREKDGDRVKGLINFLYREKHMSPFEHGSFTFFVDTPIFVAREFMRHRTGSYNEVSGRYTTLKPKFFVASPERPKVQAGPVGKYYFTAGDDKQNFIVKWATEKAYKTSWRMYKIMKRFGVANEVARNVLPVGIYTQFYVTMNPRNVMQFLQLRNAPNALAEIREVAVKMEELFAEAMPYTYDAYVMDSYKENIK